MKEEHEPLILLTPADLQGMTVEEIEDLLKATRQIHVDANQTKVRAGHNLNILQKEISLFRKEERALRHLTQNG